MMCEWAVQPVTFQIVLRNRRRLLMAASQHLSLLTSRKAGRVGRKQIGRIKICEEYSVNSSIATTHVANMSSSVACRVQWLHLEVEMQVREIEQKERTNTRILIWS